MQEAETSDLGAAAAPGWVEAARVPPSFPSPWLFMAVIGPLYFLVGGLVQALDLPLGLLWNQAFLFVWPSWLWLRRAGFRPAAFTRANLVPRRPALVLGIATVALVSASALMGFLESFTPPQWVKFFDESQVLSSVHGPWLGVLFFGVIVGAPVAEEFVFRGCLLPMLAGHMRLGSAVVVQAALFSLIHGDPIGFLPRFLLGLAFGVLWVRSGSLWAGVFAHALNNGVSTLIFLYVTPDSTPDNQVAIAVLGALAALLLALFLWLLQRYTPRLALPSEDLATVVEPIPPAAQLAGLRLYSGVALLALGAIAATARWL